MESQYQKHNKKLDAGTSHSSKHYNIQKTVHLQPKVINLLNTYFTKEQIYTLSLGPNYAIEKEPKKYISGLIVYTKVAI
jgi:hypothetical protein